MKRENSAKQCVYFATFCVKTRIYIYICLYIHGLQKYIRKSEEVRVGGGQGWEGGFQLLFFINKEFYLITF